jgi:hypothetical protein
MSGGHGTARAFAFAATNKRRSWVGARIRQTDNTRTLKNCLRLAGDDWHKGYI